jgi:hypothetical protein
MRRRSSNGWSATAVFRRFCKQIEKGLVVERAEQRSWKSRWWPGRERATPSPSALSGWLERFDDPGVADVTEAFPCGGAGDAAN